MQQREQLILKKLAEAREAQASAMTRFIQARARAMQAEARLQALRARFATPPTVSSQPSEIPPLPTDAANPADILPSDAPVLSRPSTESLPLIPETPALDTEQSISELATTLLDLEQFADLVTDLEQTDEPNDEEDTKKQQAIQLPRPFTLPVRLNKDEAETSLLIQAGFVESAESAEATTSGDDAQAGAQATTEASPVLDMGAASSELEAFAPEQSAEASPGPDTSATDITAKIPVIRQPRRKQKESE